MKHIQYLVQIETIEDNGQQICTAWIDGIKGAVVQAESIYDAFKELGEQLRAIHELRRKQEEQEWPCRLVDQDAGFSCRRPEFDSPWGYMGKIKNLRRAAKALQLKKTDWGNWEFDFNLIDQIADITHEGEYPVDMEEVESVLIALTKIEK